MAQEITSGRKRIDYKGPVALIDALKAAANRRCRRFTDYLTEAFVEKLERDGFEVPPFTPLKKTGRPPKAKKKKT
jgi:hypothetical protein